MEYGAVVVWWLALVGLGAVGLPIAAVLLRALPDRGAGLALPVALVGLFLPVYWLGQLRYGPLVVAAGALVLAAASVTCSRRSGAVDTRRFAEWVVVFTLAFGFLVAVRALDPAVMPGGGEKFLDYGLLRSFPRADRLPPEDIWFAGEPVAYYYGGHLLAASLATLTGTATRYAYNLALAGVYATLVGAAYGVAGSIAADRGRSYRLGGALGAVFVGFASNAVGLLYAVLWALPAGPAGRLATAVADRTALPAERLVSAEAFHYWTASRVIPGTINEFPLFAFLNGDLHAHMSSTPFLLLVVGICLAYARTPASARRRRRLLLFGAVPPVAGVLAVVNTWSVPSVAGLVGLTALFSAAPPRELLPDRLVRRLPPPSGARGELVRMGAALAAAMAVGLLGALVALPFVLGPATGASGRSLGLLPDRSGLLAFLLVHGWFLAVFAAALLARTAPAGRRGWAAMAVAGGVVLAGLLLDAPAVAVVVPLLALAWYRLRRSAAPGFDAVLFVAGAGLVLLVELLFVQEQAGPGRFNTVFKTYAQVWVLWGTGAGAALAGLLPERLPAVPSRGAATAGLAALLLVASSVYGVAAVGGHVEGAPSPTLDATEWARTHHADEWAAIRFLDTRPGRPVVVTAPGCWCNPPDTARPYGWANAPSTFAGLPTVAGWQHEVGYRGHEPYMRRVADVEAIYAGPPATRLELLRRYDVRYVYVGPTERALYDVEDLGDSPALSVAVTRDAVTIYAVAPAGEPTTESARSPTVRGST